MCSPGHFVFDVVLVVRVPVDQPRLSSNGFTKCGRRVGSGPALPSAEHAIRFKLVHARDRITQRFSQNFAVVLPHGGNPGLHRRLGVRKQKGRIGYPQLTGGVLRLGDHTAAGKLRVISGFSHRAVFGAWDVGGFEFRQGIRTRQRL